MPLFRLGLILAEFVRAAIQASLRLWCQKGALEVITLSRSCPERVCARRAYRNTPRFSTHALPFIFRRPSTSPVPPTIS